MQQINNEKLSPTARQTFELLAQVSSVAGDIRHVAAEVGAVVPEPGALAQVPPAILEAFRDLHAQLDEARNDIAGMQTEVERITAERNDILDQLQDARSDLATTTARLEEADAERTRFKTQCTVYERRLEKAQSDLTAETARADAAETAMANLDTAMRQLAESGIFAERSELILDFPKEIIRDYIPAVVAICEPVDSVLYAQSGSLNMRLEADNNGVVWDSPEFSDAKGVYKDALHQFLAGEAAEPVGPTLYLYSVENLKYISFDGAYNFYFGNDWIDRSFSVPEESRYNLHMMEEPVGMESLLYCWRLFRPNNTVIRLAETVRLRGKWNTANCRNFHLMLSLAWGDVHALNHFFEELPESIDISSAVESFKYNQNSLSGVSGMILNVRARRYPTINFNGANSGASQMLRQSGDNISKWMPDFDQHFIGLGIGGFKKKTTYITAQYDFQMLKKWDYDDMIATLITYSVKVDSGIKVGMAPTAIERLTNEDLAAIASKNITLIESTTFLS